MPRLLPEGNSHFHKACGLVDKSMTCSEISRYTSVLTLTQQQMTNYRWLGKLYTELQDTWDLRLSTTEFLFLLTPGNRLLTRSGTQMIVPFLKICLCGASGYTETSLHPHFVKLFEILKSTLLTPFSRLWSSLMITFLSLPNFPFLSKLKSHAFIQLFSQLLWQ